MFDSAILTSAYLLSVLAGMRSTRASEKLRGVLCEISGTESEVEKLLRVFETTSFAYCPASAEFQRKLSERPASGMKAPSSSILIEKNQICHAVSETIKILKL